MALSIPSLRAFWVYGAPAQLRVPGLLGVPVSVTGSKRRSIKSLRAGPSTTQVPAAQDPS
jgi:hypothetical protein